MQEQKVPFGRGQSTHLPHIKSTESILGKTNEKEVIMLQKLKNNVLLQTFRELKGNPKWSICTEPLWFIPYSLFLPYQTLYMSRLGLSSFEIGTTLSIGFFLQIFFALLGGVITDKMGRRKTTLIFDFISWTIPCLIWACSQNFYWFLAAAAINASFQITNTSWTCLFIEDCPPKHVTNAFTLIQLCGMLSVFLAPLSIYFIGKYDIVSVLRVLYFISAVSMSLKFILLYIFGGETKVGYERMKETKNQSFFTMLKGYWHIFLKIIGSGKMRLVVCIMFLCNISVIATNNFFSLYITEKLMISDKFVAIFPMLRTLVMLIFVILLQNLFEKLAMRSSLIIGFVLYIISHLMLLWAPEGNLLLISLYTLTEAAAFAVIIPRKDALMAHFVDIKERSRIYSLYHLIMISLSTPFGSIIGALFDLNPSYPFLFNIFLFIVAIIISLSSSHLKDLD